MIIFLLTSLIIANTKIKKDIPVCRYINVKKSVQTDNILQGGVSIDKDLPEGFYGSWSVISLAIETNNPDYQGSIGKDVWIFARDGKTITLSNPLSTARASITVNEVIGNRAKFTRKKVSENKITTETVEVIIDGDNFSGSDTMVFKYLNKNTIYKIDVVKYILKGRKIKGPTMTDIFEK